ncbi:hypothetical protein TKK_0018063 [Trichogramma kaykai]
MGLCDVAARFIPLNASDDEEEPRYSRFAKEHRLTYVPPWNTVLWPDDNPACASQTRQAVEGPIRPTAQHKTSRCTTATTPCSTRTQRPVNRRNQSALFRATISLRREDKVITL